MKTIITKQQKPVDFSGTAKTQPVCFIYFWWQSKKLPEKISRKTDAYIRIAYSSGCKVHGQILWDTVIVGCLLLPAAVPQQSRMEQCRQQPCGLHHQNTVDCRPSQRMPAWWHHSADDRDTWNTMVGLTAEEAYLHFPPVTVSITLLRLWLAIAWQFPAPYTHKWHTGHPEVHLRLSTTHWDWKELVVPKHTMWLSTMWGILG